MSADTTTDLLATLEQALANAKATRDRNPAWSTCCRCPEPAVIIVHSTDGTIEAPVCQAHLEELYGGPCVVEACPNRAGEADDREASDRADQGSPRPAPARIAASPAEPYAAWICPICDESEDHRNGHDRNAPCPRDESDLA